MVEKGVKTFDLSSLWRKDGTVYTAVDSSTGTVVEFNMCNFIDGEKYYARKTDSSGNVTPLTSSYIMPYEHSIIHPSNGNKSKVQGVSVTYRSGDMCTADEPYSFKVDVSCSWWYTKDAKPKISDVSGTDSC